jgi:type II secretory pathway predicted ATPase ExeA
MPLRTGVPTAPSLVLERPEPAPAKTEPDGYPAFYGLSRPPFEDSDDPRRFVLFDTWRPVLEALLGSLLAGQGHVLLTGPAGIGKTRLLKAAVALAQ